MGVRKTILAILFLIPGTLLSQDLNYEQEFLKAKEFYSEGRWGLAQDTFERLTQEAEDNPYSTYASFYYALSAFQQGYLTVTRDMLLQILRRTPDWEKSDDVNYWLSTTYFELGEHERALNYGSRIEDDGIREQETAKQDFFLQKINSIDSVQPLYELFPDNTAVGGQLAFLISKQNLLERDLDLLDSLVQKFDLEFIEYEKVEGPKDNYNVSLLFPFLAEELEPSASPKINQFVLDFYQGITLAADSLNQVGGSINFHLFDTKRDTTVLKALLENNQIRQSDMVIGPIYNNDRIGEFALKNQVNVIHPFAKSEDLIKDNPYSFLYSILPTQVGEKAAHHVLKDTTNKIGIVFYGENERDSLMAKSFIDSVQKGGFDIILTKKIKQGEEREALQVLASGSVVNKLELEELSLPPDSVDLIYVASTGSGGSVYSNVLAGIEARGDSIKVLGSHNWVHDDIVSKSTFYRLPIEMMAYELISYNDSSYIDFHSDYVDKYGIAPSRFSALGYDLMMFFGDKLQQYGKYFQIELRKQGFSQGPISYGFDYNNSNANQAIPVIRWNGNKVILVTDEPPPVPEEAIDEN